MRGVHLNRRELLLAPLVLPVMAVPGYAQQEGTASNDAATSLPDRAPSSDAIRSLLASRVDAGQESLGYVTLVRDAAGLRLVIYGAAGDPQSRPLDGDTVFEIGSITKVFTALLLADAVARGEVKLTDPVEEYLPTEGRPKSFDNKPFSLLDLVTYTSGLPNMPTNFRPRDKENPYTDYTVEQLYKFLAEYTPRYYPGSHYEYANLGFGLLGHVLALRAGRGYEELVVSRICGPLGLNDTRITLTPAMRERLVPGHDKSLHPVPGWDFPTLAGAGALHSTANDMMRFLDACHGKQTELTPAFQSLLEVRRQTDENGVYASAGWFVDTAHNDELVVKDGGTGGYSSFIGYSARTGIATVLLSNTGYLAPPVIANWSTTPGLGRHLLNTNFPLPALHRQVPIDPAKLAAYTGRYPLTPRFVLTVTPRDGRLMVQAAGLGEQEVFPESDTRFFSRVVDAQITFELASDGTASALVLHQNGRNRRAVKSP